MKQFRSWLYSRNFTVLTVFFSNHSIFLSFLFFLFFLFFFLDTTGILDAAPFIHHIKYSLYLQIQILFFPPRSLHLDHLSDATRTTPKNLNHIQRQKSLIINNHLIIKHHFQLLFYDLSLLMLLWQIDNSQGCY